MSLSDEKENCRPVKLWDKRLELQCEWNACGHCSESWEIFDSHLMEHLDINADNLTCQWTTCAYGATSLPLLMQHVSYHGYISRLTNIGQNVAEKLCLVQCNLKKAFNIPSDQFGFTCQWENCSKNFITIYQFLVHLKHHIKSDPYVSTEPKSGVVRCRWTGCESGFRDRSKLAEHSRTHSKEKTIGCPTCMALFSVKTKFCDHRTRQSSSAQSFKCSECFKLFPSDRLLKDHSRCHRKAYKCSLCDMTCAKPSILAKHLRFKHVTYKPYECAICDKKFVTRQNLNRHVNVHEKDNPMKCDLCDFSCRTRVGLNSHRVAKHDDASLRYECHYCQQNFTRGRYLSRHLMKQHGCQFPAGFSRFRYRKEEDGVYRLETRRLESIEVAEEDVDGLFDHETGEKVAIIASDDSPAFTEDDNEVLIEFHRFDEHGNKVIYTF